jgi:hypothetical protein
MEASGPEVLDDFIKHEKQIASLPDRLYVTEQLYQTLDGKLRSRFVRTTNKRNFGKLTTEIYRLKRTLKKRRRTAAGPKEKLRTIQPVPPAQDESDHLHQRGESELQQRFERGIRLEQEQAERLFSQRKKRELAIDDEASRPNAETNPRGEVQRRRIRAELARVASPAPSVGHDGRLDAGPNPSFDLPETGPDLATLPIRQRAIVKTILSDLPRNTPKYLMIALQNYDDELKARGVQPVLGLLKDMFAVVQAAVSDGTEWLNPGLHKGVQIFEDNHIALIKHFPLDPEREGLYARTLIDEDLATGPSLSQPFKKVAEAADKATRAGLATKSFSEVVDKKAEFAHIISTLPQDNSTQAAQSADSERAVSPRKRILLSGFGFFERTYNLLGSTATLASTPEGIALLAVLGEAISALSKFLR